MLKAYYNEFDTKAAAWLRQLIKNGDITPGEVDERSITEVTANDLVGFNRVHFFAGIGTWDYCLNNAGWGDRKIWTASLPCQPFSAAGKGLGKDDERHLLPHFLDLVRECRPDRIFGEQVERAIAHGWLDDLQANMEAEGYAIGHCVLGAHSIGAPHIRQRLYWLANSTSEMGCWRESLGERRYTEPGRSSEDIGVGDTSGATSERYAGGLSATENRIRSQGQFDGDLRIGYTDASEIDWIYCRDNKYRPIEPGISPLAHGLAKGMVYSSDPSAPIEPNNTQEARGMRLKGYGNAIQAQTAIAFIKAYMSL